MNNESTELYCGGTAEDWHNAYSNLICGKSLIDQELYRNARRVEGELKNQRDAKEHWKAKCESLVACLENDYGLDASWDGLRKLWCIERIRKAVDASEERVNLEANSRILSEKSVSRTLAEKLVDVTAERDALRAEVKKLGEQLDRLMNDGWLA